MQQVVSPSSELITIQSATQYAKVTERTIRRWIAEGKIPAYRVGPRSIRVRLSDFIEEVPTVGSIGGPGK